MKTFTLGIVSAAILMVVAGVGFGIAQAAGNQSDNPPFTLQDKELGEQFKDYMGGSSVREAVETGSLPAGSNADGNLPYDPMLSFGDQDVNPYIDVGQARGPVETGLIPESVFEESWMEEYGND